MSDLNSDQQSQMTVPVRDHRAFYRKKLFWLGTIGTLLLGGGLFLVWGSWVSSSLHKDLRARGMPTSSKQLDAWYQVADDQTNVTDRWLPVIRTMAVAEDDERTNQLPFVGAAEAPPLPGVEWPELDVAEQFLKDREPQLEAAWKASQISGVARYPVDLTEGILTDLSICQDSRLLTRLLCLDAWVASHRGDHERVVRDVHAMLALAHTFSNEPILISSLIQFAHHSMACETLDALQQNSEWTDDQLAELQTELARSDARRTIRQGFIGERAWGLDALRMMTLGPLRSANEREVLTCFAEAIAASESSWQELFEVADAFNARQLRLAGSTWQRILHMGVLQLMPAIKQAGVIAARTEARRHSLIVILAVRRQLLSGGRLPRSWDQIEDKFFPAGIRSRLIDPFCADTLRLLQRDGRLIVYSIGENREDDSGATEPGENGSRSLDVGASLSL